jgi:hypothetical protein
VDQERNLSSAVDELRFIELLQSHRESNADHSVRGSAQYLQFRQERKHISRTDRAFLCP